MSVHYILPVEASLRVSILCFYVFLFFAGATESVGKHMLEACNNNLEMAVTMFLDGDGVTQEPSTSSSSAASSSRAPPSEYAILLQLNFFFLYPEVSLAVVDLEKKTLYQFASLEV